MPESTTPVVPDLTPEQTAVLFAQFQAQQDAEKAAAKAQRENEKKAREARSSALAPVALPFAQAIHTSTPEKETSASEKARDEAKAEGKPLPEVKTTRAFSTHVTIDGVRYTLFGYLSKSSSQPK